MWVGFAHQDRGAQRDAAHVCARPDPVKEQNRIIDAILLGDPDAAGMR